MQTSVHGTWNVRKNHVHSGSRRGEPLSRVQTFPGREKSSRLRPARETARSRQARKMEAKSSGRRRPDS